MAVLRDGSKTTDERLDRLVSFDERSRNYPIMATISEDRPRTKWWRRGGALDQGREGACVGFAWCHDLAAEPVEIEGVTAEDALRVYREAQKNDEWPGEGYSGTSVIAGAKVLQEEGYLDEYRWAFGIEDVVMTLSWHGPLVLGIPWYYNMYYPDGNHRIQPKGALVGGHAILAVAYSENTDEVWLLNSWGPDWGWDGLCRISSSDLDTLLNQNGEACVPVVRGWGEKDEGEAIVIEPEVIDFSPSESIPSTDDMYDEGGHYDDEE